MRNRTLADSNPDLPALEGVFNDTFRMLDGALEGDAFRKYIPSSDRFLGAFLISAFEAAAMGVAFNIEKWKGELRWKEKLAQRVKELWALPAFTQNIGIGISSSIRMQHTIPLGRSQMVP